MLRTGACRVYIWRRYTTYFLCCHGEKYRSLRSGDLGGQWCGPDKLYSRYGLTELAVCVLTLAAVVGTCAVI